MILGDLGWEQPSTSLSHWLWVFFFFFVFISCWFDAFDDSLSVWLICWVYVLMSGAVTFFCWKVFGHKFVFNLALLQAAGDGLASLLTAPKWGRKGKNKRKSNWLKTKHQCRRGIYFWVGIMRTDNNDSDDSFSVFSKNWYCSFVIQLSSS